mgnify:CR=1 FL=1
MTLKTQPFEAARFLEDDEAVAVFITSILEENNPALLAAALGEVAKARGMGQVAKEAGVGRESLYKSLGKEGNPSFRTIVKVVNALGGRIVVESMSTGANGIRIKGSKVGLYKANGKALKTTGRDE